MVSQFIQYLRIVGMLCGLGTLSVSVQAVYPSKQPIVQVSTAQTAIEFIVKGGSAPGSTVKGAGNGQGAEVTHTNTRIQGNTVNLSSGGNTTLAGAVVKANTVNADIQGNLAITSLQDTSSFNETSKTSGASLTFSGGIPTGGSISSGRTAINSNFASVNEQSGIRAGDGGFNINVGGTTTLNGG